MKLLRDVPHLYLYPLVLCLVGVLSPTPTIAADAANLEGTWKIAAAQDSFKPKDGAVPFTQEGRKRYQQNKRERAKRNYDNYDYMTSRCASPGLPRLMLTSDRFRIWQRSGLIMFLFEWNRLFRQIDMGGLPPYPAVQGLGGTENDAFIGRAVPIAKGHWEDDTLVATTEGFDDSTLIDDLMPHGDKLKLTERIRLQDSDTLEDLITIEDSDYFTRPWQTVVIYKRQPNVLFSEHVCLDRQPAAQTHQRSQPSN